MRHSSCTVRPRPRPRGLSRGFTLVEVLIAIVVLSFGVLGALGMQVSAIRMNKEVRFQASALSLARELAEKMRGNHVVALNPTAGATTNPYLVSLTLAPGATVSAPSTNCYTSQCATGLEIANWDMYEWKLRVRDSLPSPRVVICIDSDPFDSSGKPKWSCNNTGTVAMLKVAWNRASTTGESQFTSEDTTLPMLVVPLTAGSAE